MSILQFSEADLQNFSQNRPPEKEQKRDPPPHTQVAQNTRWLKIPGFTLFKKLPF
jgi:hypothetical protein